MKKINLMVPIIMITAILTACSGEKVDERINTRDGELSFDTSKSTKSELLTSENVKYKDGYHLVLSEDEDLYVGTYIYNDKEYTAGYAVNCDFKEYLNFTNIESAEADTINGRNYTIAYYDDNRLENVLKFLAKNLENHQAILLTCTKREQEILDKLNIEYNLIEL